MKAQNTRAWAIYCFADKISQWTFYELFISSDENPRSEAKIMTKIKHFDNY